MVMPLRLPLRRAWAVPPQRGFTLLELVLVIVILGIVATMVAVFMRSPINAYFDVGRRAALTDIADTVIRRISRDVQGALPNSVRTPNTQCLEFIPTKTGGRYRAADAGALNFGSGGASSFNMFGDNAAWPVDQQIKVGDTVAIYNLGIPGASAYSQDNTAAVTSVGAASGAPPETSIGITTGTLFPLTSPSNRFQVIPGNENVVSYVCTGGVLRRTASTLTFAATNSCPATGPIIATNVSSCDFSYSGSDLQRNALTRLTLQLTSGGETVSLLREVHVNNTP